MGKRTNTAAWSDKKKRWQINVQKDGQRRSFYSSTLGRTGQREANSKADEWLDSGIVAGKRVQDLWETYLEHVKASSSNVNYTRIKYVGDCYIIPSIGHLKIDCINEGHLQSILDKAYKTGSMKKDSKQRKHLLEPLSRKTLSGIMATEKAFIKYCRVMLRATALYPESLAIPAGARYKGKTVLQPDALTTLFSVDTTMLRGKRIFDEYIHAYRFQVALGLRPGELLGLWVGDFGKNNEVHIRRSINTQGEETKGKNENAVRSIVMPPLAQQAYAAQIKLLTESGTKLNYNTPLFQISCQHTYYGRWKTYQKSNNLPPISPYELRHTFVSIAKYLPEGQIRNIVGHSRSMDTFGQYGHAITGDAEKVADAVGTLFKSVMNK